MKIAGFEVHRSVTLDRVMEACKRHSMTLDNPGFCVACGEEADGCEPDARGYTCESCDEPAVFGADELLILMA